MKKRKKINKRKRKERDPEAWALYCDAWPKSSTDPKILVMYL
jgi:hypothetical protein